MRVRLIACATVAVWLAAYVAAQQKVSTPEELDKTMKRNGQASQAMNKALASGAYADVRTQLAIVKQALADAENFWVEKKREDALKFSKEARAKVEAFEKLVATDPVDGAAAAAAAKEIGPTCRACHQVYRAQDAENNYIIKPGSLGPGGGN